MAKVKNGHISGKMGDVIHSTYLGRPYVRQKPEIVANPRTEAQQAHRTALVMIARLASDLKDAHKLGLHMHAQRNKLTTDSDFRKLNKHYCVGGTISYSQILVSKGPVDEVRFTSVVLNEQHDLIMNEETSVDDVIISRFNNDNPKILSSGIDTGTCFKLDGDDNDFVVYTILNKNGAVFKIEYQNKFIGRISVFRNCKVLFLNSVRIKDEREEKISKEVIDRNNKIFECLIKLVNEIIHIAHTNGDEIDYVVCNKAGILESSYFNNCYDIIPEHIAEQPIDIYNDDWQDFISLPNYLLKQSNRGDKIPFTTDYGHYPALLIASYDNQQLSRMSDIGYSSPDAIYTRPKKALKLYTSNFKEILDDIYRIDALKYYEEVQDIEICQKNYKRPKINIKDIYRVCLGEYYYKIEYKNGRVEETSLNINKEKNKILIRK